MHPILGQGFVKDAPKLRPTISHILGLLSHSFGSYIRWAGWEGGGGWLLLGGCRGGSGSLLSALS